jgi:REP-associated tyrosine transposase
VGVVEPGLGCDKQFSAKALDPWPVARPGNWSALVNRPIPDALRDCVKVSFDRGRPLGDDAWTIRMASRLDMQYTLNERGRPPKIAEKSGE